MKTTILICCLILVGAAIVYAEPVYLTCQVTDPKTKKTIHINLTMDEATKQVGHVIVETGFTQTTTGVFSPDTVIFVIHNSPLEVQYTVNRLDLSLQRRMRFIVNSQPAVQDTDRGKCSIVKAPKERKF